MLKTNCYLFYCLICVEHFLCIICNISTKIRCCTNGIYFDDFIYEVNENNH